MPKEQLRKRGKRKPKTADETASYPLPAEVSIDPTPGPSSDPSPVAGPSTIHPARAALLNGGRYKPSPSNDQAIGRPDNRYQSRPNGGHGDGNGESEGDVNGEAVWTRGPRADQEFPFGIVDPNLKAYFRNVEEQIRDWEGTSSVGEERDDRKQFLSSILGELRTHELSLSTDPDCSVVLERLLPSVGDRGRRVLGDSFAGSWETLIRHRFGSHVVQSWIRLGADTLDREGAQSLPRTGTKGKKGKKDKEKEENGVEGGLQGIIKKENDEEDLLPSMKDLFIGLLTSLGPTLSTLLTHPHASPPLRLLLLVLSPDHQLPDLTGNSAQGTAAIRSKRSGKYRKNHAVEGKGFLGDEGEGMGLDKKGKNKEGEGGKERMVAQELVDLGKEVRAELVRGIGEGEWRIIGVDVVGSPAVQLLMQLEAEHGQSEQPGSLLDNLTEGLVSEILNDQPLIAKQYIPSLLTTQPGTHLLETIFTTSPSRIFTALWDLYFIGKIGRLAGHPTANYVVARAVGRLNAHGVEVVVRECRAVAGGKGMIKTGRTSVLQALNERAEVISEARQSVIELIISALDLPDTEKGMFVPCLMALKTLPTYRALLNGEAEPEETDIPFEAVDKEAEDQAAAAAKYSAWQNRRTQGTKQSELAPNLKGSLLLQGLLALEGVNDVVLESLFAQDNDTLMDYATNPISSRFLDVVLTQPAVQSKWKRKLMSGFMGRYKELVEDRMGSRVGDTIWDHADGFMKEKIARSLAPHATPLSNSPYGRFFAKKLNLHLLQRRPDEWKEEMLGLKHHFAHQKEAKPASTTTAQVHVADGVKGEAGDMGGEKKRKQQVEDLDGEDIIDELFAEVRKVKKHKKARP